MSHVYCTCFGSAGQRMRKVVSNIAKQNHYCKACWPLGDNANDWDRIYETAPLFSVVLDYFAVIALCLQLGTINLYDK